MPWAEQPRPERREVPPTPPCEQILSQTRDWLWTSHLLFSHTRTFRHKYTKRKAYTSSPQHFLQGGHTERVIILNTATRQHDLRWSNTFELLRKGWVMEWTSHRFSEIGWMHSHHPELPAVGPPGMLSSPLSVLLGKGYRVTAPVPRVIFFHWVPYTETCYAEFILEVKEIPVHSKWLYGFPSKTCLPDREDRWPTSEVLTKLLPAFLAPLLRRIRFVCYITVALYFMSFEELL